MAGILELEVLINVHPHEGIDAASNGGCMGCERVVIVAKERGAVLFSVAALLRVSSITGQICRR